MAENVPLTYTGYLLHQIDFQLFMMELKIVPVSMKEILDSIKTL